MILKSFCQIYLLADIVHGVMMRGIVVVTIQYFIVKNFVNGDTPMKHWILLGANNTILKQRKIGKK